ncbi:MAG: hypothetical protein ABI859_06790 [Pseudomonadota bacterium]
MRCLVWCLVSLLSLQLAACVSKSGDPPVARTQADLLGTWVPDASPRELKANGAPPPLNEDAAALYAKHKQRFAAGDAGYDPTTWCAGPGLPRILTMPYAFEIRRSGDHLAFIHSWYRWFRAVDLNGPEPEPPLPTTLGFPVGRFEGNTLVIRTIGLTDTTVLDASGLPHSDQLVITERLRVLPDGRLEDRMTIEDPDTFTQPWETVLTFHRDAAARVTDDVCPDRLAKGEPAELLANAGPARATATASAAPKAKSVATPPVTPRLTGMWEAKTFGIFVPEAEARFSPSGKELFDRNATAMKSGHIMQTAWTSCRPGAVSTMTMSREAIMVLESSDEITILYEMPRMVRRIHMGAEHPKDMAPSYVGHSVGRWEGDTLVVDSIGFNGYAELGAGGQPTSPRLHTVERFTPAADGSYDIEVTITDPEYYSEAVQIKRGWKKKASRHPLEYDCMENPREEDYKSSYFVREQYRPVCMRVAGKGAELSKMVCASGGK